MAFSIRLYIVGDRWMVKEHRWNVTYKGYPKYLGGNTCRCPTFCPLQISHWVAWGWDWTSAVRGWRFTNRVMIGPPMCPWAFRTILVGWWGKRCHSWLRHCATSRTVADSIPDGVTGSFQWHSSGRTMALGLTQPLTEMSTRNNSWGVKAAGA
jgi:hypothetical protein